jgi:hypothetical protein
MVAVHASEMSVNAYHVAFQMLVIFMEFPDHLRKYM